VRRLLALCVTCAAAVGLAACGGSSAAGASHTGGATAGRTGTVTRSSAAGASPTTAATESRTGCHKVAAAKPQPARTHLHKPGLHLDAAKTYIATVATNCGAFSFKLDVSDSPHITASFVALAHRHFYDGLAFQRVARGFVIQGGDPLGTGAGGPGYTVRDRPPSSAKYTRGTVAMAKTQTEPAGTAGSQFFVVTGNEPLPPVYGLLGHVTEGQAVVDRIGRVPTQPPSDGMPVQPIVISRLTVSTR
jgi:cyclophilin family peptidyl-prolyl cis-trans isomerase